jgi:hypothetical protein
VGVFWLKGFIPAFAYISREEGRKITAVGKKSCIFLLYAFLSVAQAFHWPVHSEWIVS